MTKLYGWKGRILRVNLSNGKVSKQELPKEWMRDYIGCRGINARILYGEVKPGIDSFGPDNKLIFGTGPLDGTPIGMGRVSVTTRSDRGCVAEGGFGGFWGPELKYAGYDHIVVEGISERPCYIWIDDENVEVRSAEHLWGKDTFDTDRMIKEEVGDFDVQVAYIGPAGENLVHSSLVLTDLCRGGGRSGCGEVMGSKRLKAIAVRGSGGVQVADPEEYRRVWTQIFQAHDHYHTDDHYVPVYSVWGSCGMSRMFSFTGSLQTRNAQEAEFYRIDDVCAEKYFEKYAVRGTACFCCPYPAEGKWHEVKDGEYAGTKGKNIWAGGLFAFSALIGNTDLGAVVKLVDNCNRLGMDQYTVAYSIAWAMECYERGILTKKDTDGLELTFGNHRAAVELTNKIAYRKGFGGLLALGVEKASQKVGRGSDRYKLTVKGLELEMMPWRNLYQAALGNATSETGPDHTKWYPPYPSNPKVATPELLEELGLDLDLKSVFNTRVTDGKAKFMKFRYDSTTFIECLPSCVYMIRGRLGIDFRPWVKILNACTGLDFTLEEALQVGARVVTLERSFNVREGYRRQHDSAPRRMREEPVGAQFYGPLTQEKLDTMLDEYYTLQGWDRETSIPTRKKLQELRLYYVADDLEKHGVKVK